MPDTSGELAELREANARLRGARTDPWQVVEAKDAEIAALHAEVGKLWAQVADLAVTQSSPPQVPLSTVGDAVPNSPFAADAAAPPRRTAARVLPGT